MEFGNANQNAPKNPYDTNPDDPNDATGADGELNCIKVPEYALSTRGLNNSYPQSSNNTANSTNNTNNRVAERKTGQLRDE